MLKNPSAANYDSCMEEYYEREEAKENWAWRVRGFW